MKISGRPIGLDHPPYVIAELGVNHDGRIERALELVDAAAAAGADAVKTQFFEASRLLSRAAVLADYQARSGQRSAMEMLAALELTVDDLARVVRRAHDAGVHAIVTVFSVELVAPAFVLPFDAAKTASTDIINRPLIDALMATSLPLLVSTGAAALDEVLAARAWIGAHPHALLHCVSSYPTADDDAALGGSMALRERLGGIVGYSDHTTSIESGGLAVAGGASVLEKHVTWDRTAAGPDHAASLDSAQFTEYVRFARRAWTMRGPLEKTVAPHEREVREIARQSITTTRALAPGHAIEAGDLTIKRPGTGLSPAQWSAVVGRTIAQAIEADMPLTEGHLE